MRIVCKSMVEQIEEAIGKVKDKKTIKYIELTSEEMAILDKESGYNKAYAKVGMKRVFPYDGRSISVVMGG